MGEDIINGIIHPQNFFSSNFHKSNLFLYFSLFGETGFGAIKLMHKNPKTKKENNKKKGMGTPRENKEKSKKNVRKE